MRGKLGKEGIKEPGLIPRTIEHLFKQIMQNKEKFP
jgi:hypothetical protein